MRRRLKNPARHKTFLRFCVFASTMSGVPTQTGARQMAAKVIAVLNEKGGAGKTTTATNLACCLAIEHGLKVMMVDHDPQSAASKFAARRAMLDDDLPEGEAPKTIPIVSMGLTLARDLPRISHGYDVVIIDGLPVTDKITTEAVKAADLVVIPVQPSQYELWASEPTINLVKARRELTDGYPLCTILITRAIQGSIMESVVRAQLDEIGLPVINTHVINRQSYVQGVAQGLSVVELPKSDKARIEFLEVTKEVLELLK